jgi:hypothetical protein
MIPVIAPAVFILPEKGESITGSFHQHSLLFMATGNVH